LEVCGTSFLWAAVHTLPLSPNNAKVLTNTSIIDRAVVVATASMWLSQDIDPPRRYLFLDAG